MNNEINMKLHHHLLVQLFTCIDNTSLNPIDSKKSIESFCRKTLNFGLQLPENINVASVCVYPNYVSLAKSLLSESSVSVAAVAGAFPSSQLPLSCKLNEIGYALECGADEIDTVISLGNFFDGDYGKVYDELSAIRSLTRNKVLKVILETGELKTPDHIALASDIAIEAGADFIKTSTGKTQVSATPEAVEIMLNSILQHFKKTGKQVGLKVAGGISTSEEAIKYAFMAQDKMGLEYICNQTFRIGTSRLTDKLFNILTE